MENKVDPGSASGATLKDHSHLDPARICWTGAKPTVWGTALTKPSLEHGVIRIESSKGDSVRQDLRERVLLVPNRMFGTQETMPDD